MVSWAAPFVHAERRIEFADINIQRLCDISEDDMVRFGSRGRKILRELYMAQKYAKMQQKVRRFLAEDPETRTRRVAKERALTRTRRVRARARPWDSRPHQTSNLRAAMGRDRSLPAAGNLVLPSREVAVEEVEVKGAAWMAAARAADDPNHHPSVTAGARIALRQRPHEPFRRWPPSRLHG